MKVKQAKFFSFLLVVAGLLFVVSGVSAKEAKIARNIGVIEAFAKVESGVSGAYLVDVRTPGEYQ